MGWKSANDLGSPLLVLPGNYNSSTRLDKIKNLHAAVKARGVGAGLSGCASVARPISERALTTPS